MTGRDIGGPTMPEHHLATASTITRRRLLKSILALSSLATASPLLTAWPSPAAAAQTNAPTATPAVNGSVTVVFWQHEDPRLTAATKEKIDAYKQVAPNVEIDFNSTPHVDY